MTSSTIQGTISNEDVHAADAWANKVQRPAYWREMLFVTFPSVLEQHCDNYRD